jgi:hypothetical protein
MLGTCQQERAAVPEDRDRDAHREEPNRSVHSAIRSSGSG